MMKYFKLFLISLVTILLISSCVLYPINQNLNRVDKLPEYKYESSYNYKNLYQLRVYETREYLKVRQNDDTLVSDFPFRKFQQSTKKQASSPNDEDGFFIEETYMYLDRDPKYKNQFSGFAFYFITYPIIERNPDAEGSFARHFFNNPDNLFTNIIRCVMVGYWFKKNNGDVIIIFRNDFDDIFLLSGKWIENKGVLIDKISHPLKNNEDILRFNFFSTVENYSLMSTSTKKSYSRTNKEALKTDRDKIFDYIKKRITFIELNDVFGFDENINALHFLNIPKQRKFGLEKFRKNYMSKNESSKDTLLVKGFKLGRDRFYMNLADSLTYEFKSKFVQFLKPLK